MKYQSPIKDNTIEPFR